MKKEFQYLCGVGFVLSATGILVQDALALGESPTQPAYSCKQILTAQPGSSSGVYWVDPDGKSGNGPFEVYCDMSTDGGGWTLALNSMRNQGSVTTDIAVNTGFPSPMDAHTRNVSQLAISQPAEIRHFIRNGGYVLHQKYTGQYHLPLPFLGAWTVLPGNNRPDYLQLNYGMPWQSSGPGVSQYGRPWYFSMSYPYVSSIPTSYFNGPAINLGGTLVAADQYSIYVREQNTPPPGQCFIDADCDDDLFCNGAEACDVNYSCIAGVAPDLNDGNACTVDSCDETNDLISHILDFSTCAPLVITEGDSVSVNISEDGAPISFSLTLNATNAEGDTLTWSVSSLASHGIASASGQENSIAIGYIPDVNYRGQDSFVVKVDDSNGRNDICTVTINIVNLADDALTDQAVSEAVTISEETISYLLYGDFDLDTDVDGDDLSWFSRNFGNLDIDIDNDLDGFSEIWGDCNDKDEFVFPDTDEECGDLIDNNCDGQVDENCE